VEKVFDTLIPYSTNSVCQAMATMLNVACSYFHINSLKLVTLVNETSALINMQSKKLVTLVNETSVLINGQLEKRVNLVMEQMLGLRSRRHWYVLKLC
jgi:hypothetical protein